MMVWRLALKQPLNRKRASCAKHGTSTRTAPVPKNSLTINTALCIMPAAAAGQ